MLAALAAAALLASAPPAGPLTLRDQPVAEGRMVTIGDLFEGCGDACGRIIGPAPKPGGAARFSAGLVASAVRSAGLVWSAPPGAAPIEVRSASEHDLSAAGQSASGATGVRKGETVTVRYEAPGLRLTLRGRALDDARIGQTVRVQNAASNRAIEATVTGPGAAAALAP